VIDADGNADFVFTVGMQPGNNYRVAVVVDAPASQLDDLQVDHPAASRYVSAESEEQTTSFSGALSSLLTVWRKLHVEQDTMPAPSDDHTNDPQVNFVTGTVQSILADTPAGSTGLEYRVSLSVSLTPSSPEDRFADGRLIINGQPYTVLEKAFATGAPLSANQVRVKDDPSHPLAPLLGTSGQTFWLFDDDEQYVASGLKLPQAGTSLITPWVRARFVPAYIELDTTKPNADANFQFILNMTTAQIEASPHLGHTSLPTSASFWAARVVASFQRTAVESWDPANSGLVLGEAKRGDAYIFLETIRDLVFPQFVSSAGINNYAIQANVTAAENEMLKLLNAVVAHEIGHLPRNDVQGSLPNTPPGSPTVMDSPDHLEQGLMFTAPNDRGDKRDDFTAMTIARFRKSADWYDPD
jgi:hypothetical protein